MGLLMSMMEYSGCGAEGNTEAFAVMPLLFPDRQPCSALCRPLAGRSFFRLFGGLSQLGRSFIFLTVSYRKIPLFPVYPGCRKNLEKARFFRVRGNAAEGE
jgi:hypothetical protein